MPHELYLLRHGETEWNREGRIQGSQDSPLTARGRAQATAQADILAREVPQMWQLARYCSPLRRARDTARIALDGLVPVIDRRLREVDFGAWEGLTPAERGARDPQLVAGGAGDLDLCRSAPGGEGLIGLERPCERGLDQTCGRALSAITTGRYESVWLLGRTCPWQDARVGQVHHGGQ